MQKTVDVTIRLTINVKGEVEISDVINEMDYDFTSATKGATIVDTEVVEFDEEK